MKRVKCPRCNMDGYVVDRIEVVECYCGLRYNVNFVGLPVDIDPARVFERLCYMADKELLRDMQIAVDWN